MHYSIQSGQTNTISDKFQVITDKLSTRNLLPTIVAGLTALWIGLLFIAIQQTGSLNPGTPADLTATRNEPPMSVVAASGDAVLQTSSVTAPTGEAAQSSLQSTDSTTSMDKKVPANNPQENSVASTLEPVVGGRGGGDDTPTTTDTSPVAPPVPAGDPALDVELDTPITPDPISVDLGLDNGVQLGTDVGGLIDLDIGLGL